MDRRYDERRAELVGLDLHGSQWQVPNHHVGDGDALLELTRRQGLEGVMAKRLDCPYTPGRRSGGWIKIKNVHRTSLVIGGWIPGEGGRSGRLGALTVGFHDDGGLRYAGRVGTGFGQAELHAPRAPARAAGGRRARRSRAGSRRTETHFVRPELVCDVEFREWTRTRTLRAPSYKGAARRHHARAGGVRAPLSSRSTKLSAISVVDSRPSGSIPGGHVVDHAEQRQTGQRVAVEDLVEQGFELFALPADVGPAGVGLDQPALGGEDDHVVAVGLDVADPLTHDRAELGLRLVVRVRRLPRP